MRLPFLRPSTQPAAVPAAIGIAPQMFAHYSDAPWDANRHPNFVPAEFACQCCGEFWYDLNVFDMIQEARDIVGHALQLNSAHRCELHNVAVGGAPASEHLRLALDVNVAGYDRFAILDACQRAGFTTFGYYQTFLHTDPRPGRMWTSGPQAEALWKIS